MDIERTAPTIENQPDNALDSADIYAFQDDVTNRLMRWARWSVISGVMMSVHRSKFIRGIASQMISWGAIDAAIAYFGQKASEKNRTEPDGYSSDVLDKQADNLYKALVINAALDVLYVIAGLITANRSKSKYNRGIGLGIVIQGAFLFVFDALHALALGPRNNHDS